jgi:Intu longin-like domain 3
MSVMNLLCDLYESSSDDDNNALISSEKERIIKTYNDYWIFAKTYNSRSIYLILHKSSTLIDIADEAQRLLSEIVKNVYFTNQQ